MSGEDSWQADRNLVLNEIKRFNDNFEKFDDKLDELTKCVAVLQVKSGLLGAISGGVTSGIAIGILFLKNLITKN